MTCPRCDRDLVEVDRDGISIDRCEACRGIWLDRGELEKLIARSAPRGRPDDDDGDDDERDHRRGRTRGSWWEIFD